MRFSAWLGSGLLGIFVVVYVGLPLIVRIAVPGALERHGIPAAVDGASVNPFAEELRLSGVRLGAAEGPHVT